MVSVKAKPNFKLKLLSTHIALILGLMVCTSQNQAYAANWNDRYGDGSLNNDHLQKKYDNGDTKQGQSFGTYGDETDTKPYQLVFRYSKDKGPVNSPFFVKGTNIYLDILSEDLVFDVNNKDKTQNYILGALFNEYNSNLGYDYTEVEKKGLQYAGKINILSKNAALKLHSEQNNLVSGLRVEQKGKITFWTQDELSQFDDVKNLGAQNIAITVTKDNSSGQTHGLYNKLGEASLHSSEKFDFTTSHNSQQTTTDHSIGIYNDGGNTDLKTTTATLNSSGTVTKNQNKLVGSFGYLGISNLNIAANFKKDPNLSNKEQLKENIEFTGSTFISNTTLNVNSTSTGGAAFGLTQIGSQNTMTLNGDTTINAKATENNGSTLNNAYGLVNYFKEETAKISYKESERGGNITLDYEIKDGNSKIETNNIAIYADAAGDSFGILQKGLNNTTTLKGDVYIATNINAQDAAFNDSYALINSSKNALIETQSNVTINVNKASQEQSLHKARALEALDASTIKVNASGGEYLVTVNGDLHTSKKALDDLNIDIKNANSSGSYLDISIGVLPWIERDNNVEFSLPLAYQDSAFEDLNFTQSADNKTVDNASPYQDHGSIIFTMNKEGSYLNGAANGNIDITVGEKTQWNVTSDSLFKELRASGGVIDLYHESMQFDASNPYQKIHVNTLSNTGINVSANSPSTFVLNTDILGKGVEVLSFDGTTYYKKAASDGLKNNQVTVYDGKITSNGSYTYNGQDVDIALKDFTLATAQNMLSHEIRHGDFIYIDSVDGPQTHNVKIYDQAVMDGSLDYTDKVLKFATVASGLTLKAQAVTNDTSAYTYLPKIWSTAHTDKSVSNGQVVDNEKALSADGKINDAINNTYFTREEYDLLIKDQESSENGGTISSDTVDYWLSGYDKKLSNLGDLVTSLYGIHFNNAYLQTLRQRLGEVRYGAQDGIWFKALALEDGSYGIASDGYSQKMHGFNLGYDKIVSVDENSMYLVGGSLKTANATQKLNSSSGSGKTKAYGLNLYATYAVDNGFYADFVLSSDIYSQDLSTTTENNTAVCGNYDTLGYGASIEIGRMFSSSADDLSYGPWYNSYFIEPQAQISYYRLEGKNFSLNTGTQVRQDDYDNLIGRLGLVLGKKFNYGDKYQVVDKRYSQFYLKAGVKHDFLGSRTVYIAKDRFSAFDIGITTIYYGAGFDWNFADNLRLYGQFEREEGDGYQKDFEINLGLKWDF